ncbi:uncharacterized protein BJ171DRAFT_511071 [Polychytrium aggregatum]|uniref:uncharacterized protein n=1 Tax=Polychytrium aggregatum TaxID=110093 RepID=UPI0022FEC664|nr:uncharacterized protein BJ171DRAFT_511071 [Polychytrium aggregatum]KAI9203178.1 hypothetical protein BJ171DRAFT_511071 [Polychytrium aggregatum]
MILRADLNGGQITEFKQEATRRYIVHLLKSAADNDHTMAQFHLAECHLNGSKVDRSHTKALNLYRKLASRGISQAQVALGQRYEAGEGVDRDFDTAIEWYTKAADQGSEDGRHHIMFLRGWASFIGHSVEQSDIGALSYWQEVSTKSTNPVLKSIATHMVGWMHYLGRGTQQDELKGVKIIRENESHGFKLGEDQCLGSNWNSVSSDSHAAHKFFELCQLGSDKIWLCKHLMAVCLVNGFGTAQDQKRAANAFQQLASEGHAASQFWLGGCYYNHWGVSQDYRQAFEWYNKSAEQDNSYGQWMVGLCYSGGAGVLKDDNKAAEWFRRSAEQGNRCGQNALGRCYKDGKGVAEDIETAAFWYCKAADQGHLYAVKALKELV